MVGSLEIMEAFLNGKMDPDAFKTQFSREFAPRPFGRNLGPEINDLVKNLIDFYEVIHLYSPFPDRREEEPLLLDGRQLRERTNETFTQLRRAWLEEAARV
jgi:hypothetical protein